MTDVLRVALIGGGKMARQHASAIRCIARAQFVAVADPLVARSELSTRFGDDVPTWSDPLEMLAAVKPDVVHVVTPPATHAELAKAALEAGANVYVEKPFALTAAEARSLLELAAARGLRVCAAHQVLFQDAARSYRAHFPVIGKILHAESFFSFRPVRRTGGAAGALSTVEQLIDILPHPVYLLLDALGNDGGEPAEITGLDISIDGEVRAILRRGDTLAYLTVSLRARPVESWLRVMGSNGKIEVDFVLGHLVRQPGPGASAPAVVIKPFSHAWQMAWGSFRSLLKLIARRDSYPGLGELLGLFYASILDRKPSPVDGRAIIETVRICEQIGGRLRAEEAAVEELASARLSQRSMESQRLISRGAILLTGGTGFLGRVTADVLQADGWEVRIPTRRLPRASERLPGVTYVVADLSESAPDALLRNIEIVIHLAAETAGNRSEHERNTISLTRNLLDAMSRVGTPRLVSVSSVAVLKPSRWRRPLDEASPVDYDNADRGPYVWAKAEAERLTAQASAAGGIAVRSLRLGPLVNFKSFAAPGRLGREIGRLFVAMGSPSDALPVCGVETAAHALARCAREFETMPPIVNLIETPAPQRKELVQRLRSVRPDLKVMWLPFWILRPLSGGFRAVSRLLSPGKPALDLYAAFASQAFDDRLARLVIGTGEERKDRA